MGAFGDKFRSAREAKSLSLDDVSNVTKISSRMLHAIEEEHFDQLPGGVFNKGFIRAYAKHLGLNAEDAITDYLACLRQAQIDSHEAWDSPPAQTSPKPAATYQKPEMKPQPPAQIQVEELPELQLPRAEHVRRPQTDYVRKRGSGIPWNLIALAVAVVAFAAYLWVRHTRVSHTEASVPAKPATQSAPVATTASSSSDTSQPVATPPSAPKTAATTPAPANTPAPAPVVKQEIPKQENPKQETKQENVKQDTIKSATNKEDQPTSTVQEKHVGSDVIIRTFAPAKPAKPAGPMTLVVRASETSWISITVDGSAVTHETLIAPAAASFRASRQIVARIGNAAGISFLFNGQEIPAQGTTAEVKTFVFDPTGMHEAPNQPPVQNH